MIFTRSDNYHDDAIVVKVVSVFQQSLEKAGSKRKHIEIVERYMKNFVYFCCTK